MGVDELKKIGIIGGSGYIGLNLASHLRKKFQVRIIDIESPARNIDDVEYFKCDIRNFDEVKKAINGLDLVIHSAIIQIPRINEEKRLGYEVNVIGTQNICRAVVESKSVKGLILTGTWHTIGEREINGVIDESFGYRPDKVEDRARLYAISKLLQEGIVRYYDELSNQIFGIIRMGTVLGEGMPKKTAANIFIERGLKGQSITPYKHSMHRPMLYVDIRDVCKAFELFANKILNDEIKKENNSLHHIINVVYPEPITVLQLAEMVRDIIIELTSGKICPSIEIISSGLPSLFSQDDKDKFKVNISKAIKILGLKHLISPKESIRHIVKGKLSKS